MEKSMHEDSTYWSYRVKRLSELPDEERRRLSQPGICKEKYPVKFISGHESVDIISALKELNAQSGAPHAVFTGEEDGWVRACEPTQTDDNYGKKGKAR